MFFRLFVEGYHVPLYRVVIKSRAAIIDVKWSATKPSIFFALDKNSTLYIFDLLSEKQDKLVLEQDVSISKQDQRVQVTTKNIALPQTQQHHRFYASQQGMQRISINNNSVALGYSDGRLDVHILNEDFSSLNQKQDLSSMDTILKMLFAKDSVDL
jgi:hypothetical protein